MAPFQIGPQVPATARRNSQCIEAHCSQGFCTARGTRLPADTVAHSRGCIPASPLRCFCMQSTSLSRSRTIPHTIPVKGAVCCFGTSCQPSAGRRPTLLRFTYLPRILSLHTSALAEVEALLGSVLFVVRLRFLSRHTALHVLVVGNLGPAILLRDGRPLAAQPVRFTIGCRPCAGGLRQVTQSLQLPLIQAELRTLQ